MPPPVESSEEPAFATMEPAMLPSSPPMLPTESKISPVEIPLEVPTLRVTIPLDDDDAVPVCKESSPLLPSLALLVKTFMVPVIKSEGPEITVK